MNRAVIVFGLLLVVGCTKLIPPSARSEPQVAKKSEPEPEPAPPKVDPPKVDPPKVDPPKPAPKPPEPKKVINLGMVDGLKLQADYVTNPAAAHSVYGGKIMTLPVVVNSIEPGLSGAIYVTMSTIAKASGEPDVPNYSFLFPKAQTKGIDQLRRGSSCLIEGVCFAHYPDTIARGGRDEFKWHLEFKDCRLVSGTN
ncbi:hypothetical protein [Frigoriglobus tundricola]|uniref:Lipoprotein n=1 Tax=Frigoriglobus tundricola TaxID=2774151 RepID=A0A6M5YP29_9BACT|nr:hypothetical protein [Frigoriglobus tundricola]QJW95033.1 hypothetical protein FTUN_2559 [Frigoriglobus tundricola]